MAGMYSTRKFNKEGISEMTEYLYAALIFLAGALVALMMLIWG